MINHQITSDCADRSCACLYTIFACVVCHSSVLLVSEKIFAMELESVWILFIRGLFRIMGATLLHDFLCLSWFVCRRESERRNHSLARHADILAAVETRLSLLNMTFMKYVDSNLCCFIPGKVGLKKKKKMLFFIFCFLYLGSVTVFISEIKAMKWTKCTLRRRQLKWLSGRLHSGTRFLQNFALWRKNKQINAKSHFLFPFFIFFSPVSVHWSPCAVFLLR